MVVDIRGGPSPDRKEDTRRMDVSCRESKEEVKLVLDNPNQSEPGPDIKFVN